MNVNENNVKSNYQTNYMVIKLKRRDILLNTYY